MSPCSAKGSCLPRSAQSAGGRPQVPRCLGDRAARSRPEASSPARVNAGTSLCAGGASLHVGRWRVLLWRDSVPADERYQQIRSGPAGSDPALIAGIGAWSPTRFWSRRSRDDERDRPRFMGPLEPGPIGAPTSGSGRTAWWRPGGDSVPSGSSCRRSDRSTLRRVLGSDGVYTSSEPVAPGARREVTSRVWKGDGAHGLGAA